MIDLAPLKESLNDKPVAVMGLARSGIATIEACAAADIPVIAWDDNEDRRAEAEDILPGCTQNLMDADLAACALLVLAPGIPLTHPEPHPLVKRAEITGLEIICDIELFFRAKPEKTRIVAVTGTNGKSTTTALIAHVFRHAGEEAEAGGNIGRAALALPPLGVGGVYVMELSSYQLDLCPTFAPDVAVLLNISPDHLDRHGGMDGYIAAKRKIFRHAETDIIAVDDDYTQEIAKEEQEAGRNVVMVSNRNPVPGGVYINDQGAMIDNTGGQNKPVINMRDLKRLQGRHNWQNVAAAYAACRRLDLPAKDIGEGLKDFPGLEHRQKLVAECDNVRYVNDSKATNPEAALFALKTYDHIFWIAGGQPKDGGFDALEPELRHVRHAFLIGEAEDALAKWLDQHEVEYTRCGTMDQAARQAHNAARESELPNAVVLLSPACASFDQFRDFEDRGNMFSRIVRNILEEEGEFDEAHRLESEGGGA